MANQNEGSSTPSSEIKFVWNRELSHGLLQLCNDQNDKGHWKGTCLDEIGRQSVRAEFLKRFGLDLPWKTFKNRMDHIKKQYDVYKRITRTATGLGFNEFGELDMSADWWNELISSCPEASRLRSHPLKDIPLLDRLYARVNVSVNEGWQPRAGPSQLRPDPPSPLIKVNDSDEELTPLGPIGKSCRGKGKDVASSSRKRAQPDKWDRLTTALEDQGQFWKGGRETFESLNPFSCAVCMQELTKMTLLNHESELYWAAIDYLASDENGRQIFMSLPNEEEKIKFLERKTGKSDWAA
ncbi:PREDICTED: uncharacterized protein LOC104698807 [Camelina sativa]|uniref:Uncharacterized protein LOC104698807 n=1 Tax=Camelina sativa TaxID=90675 RepID=A0ABM0SKK1_CAMSA|nr:PREDICTED: uncharacterized protein LOC104698807 [Camelina sativa]